MNSTMPLTELWMHHNAGLLDHAALARSSCPVFPSSLFIHRLTLRFRFLRLRTVDGDRITGNPALASLRHSTVLLPTLANSPCLSGFKEDWGATLLHASCGSRPRFSVGTPCGLRRFSDAVERCRSQFARPPRGQSRIREVEVAGARGRNAAQSRDFSAPGEAFPGSLTET